ncbi:uncharacterized protein VTP21DRAFT_9737 [Calcarisporiella thermophila]|uniref:uncharacterized protein n=1 Tax=Calcarisporiella thermophila TaxID=911321 RepID=UPI0037443D7D
MAYEKQNTDKGSFFLFIFASYRLASQFLLCVVAGWVASECPKNKAKLHGQVDILTRSSAQTLSLFAMGQIGMRL